MMNSDTNSFNPIHVPSEAKNDMFHRVVDGGRMDYEYDTHTIYTDILIAIPYLLSATIHLNSKWWRNDRAFVRQIVS